MAELQRDFRLGDDGDIIIQNGDFAIGEALTDDVRLLLLTCKGEHMLDFLCGCDLVRRKNSRIRRTELEAVVRKQVERDGKSWDAVREGIRVKANG